MEQKIKDIKSKLRNCRASRNDVSKIHSEGV